MRCVVFSLQLVLYRAEVVIFMFTNMACAGSQLYAYIQALCRYDGGCRCSSGSFVVFKFKESVGAIVMLTFMAAVTVLVIVLLCWQSRQV